MLAFPNSHAQAYEPGLLVRANGDTLRGELENGFWTEPPAFIRFRASSSAPAATFRPHQLRAVSFTGGRHFRFLGLPLDNSAETRLEHLPRGNAMDIRVDSVLAEVLVDGVASLLRVPIPGTVHYAIYEPGRPTLDLCARKYLSEESAGEVVVKDGNNYHGQLAVHFIGCTTAAQAAATAPFTPAGLAAVVLAYNREYSPARQPGRSLLGTAVAQRRLALRAGVVVGLRYNRVNSFAGQAATACLDCRPVRWRACLPSCCSPTATGPCTAS